MRVVQLGPLQWMRTGRDRGDGVVVDPMGRREGRRACYIVKMEYWSDSGYGGYVRCKEEGRGGSGDTDLIEIVILELW